jgi:hypothetical protein
VRDISGNQLKDATTGEDAISILTQAKAAKAVLEDELSDETTIVSLAKSISMPNKKALGNLGVDYDGNKIDDEVGLAEKPTEERGYIRYAAGRGDRGTTMALISYIGDRGKIANKAAKRIEEAKKLGKEPDKKDVTLVSNVKKAQAAFLESAGSSLPPWIGGSDQQAIAEGRFEYNIDEAAIAAVAGGKLTADAFAAMDVNNRDRFVKALETMKPDDVNSIIDGIAKKFVNDAADAGHTMTFDEAKETALQNFAQVVIPIDKAQFDVRLNRGLATRDIERYDSMRKKLKEIAGPTRPPSVRKPDGSDTPYTGYNA